MSDRISPLHTELPVISITGTGYPSGISSENDEKPNNIDLNQKKQKKPSEAEQLIIDFKECFGIGPVGEAQLRGTIDFKK